MVVISSYHRTYRVVKRFVCHPDINFFMIIQSDSLCYTSGHIAKEAKRLSETMIDIFCLFCFGKGMHYGKLV